MEMEKGKVEQIKVQTVCGTRFAFQFVARIVFFAFPRQCLYFVMYHAAYALCLTLRKSGKAIYTQRCHKSIKSIYMFALKSKLNNNANNSN